MLKFIGLLLHGAVRGRKLLAFPIDFMEKPRVAHRQHRLMSKCLHQPQQVRRKRACAPAQHDQRAEDALLIDQRHRQRGTETGRCDGFFKRIWVRRCEVFDCDRRAVCGGLTKQAVVGAYDAVVAA